MNLDQKYKNKNVLITGGLGFIGSNLARALVDLGAKVTILDALLSPYGGNMFNIHDIEVEFYEGDIRNKETVEKLIKNKDYIFNLAAQVDYLHSQNKPFLDLEINCAGHLTVLEACRQFNKQAVILFSGSRMMYGRIEYNPVDENHPTQPLSIYGVNKLAGEKYYQMYNSVYGLKTVALRIANPYGPRQQMKHSSYGIVNWFVRSAMENKKITIFGEGSQIRDYVYVGDIAEAMLRTAATDKAYGDTFNLGSGKGTRFYDMAKEVVRTVGKGSIVNVDWPKDYFNVETGDYISDISKLKNTTGWSPKISLNEGIIKTFDYYLENKRHYW